MVLHCRSRNDTGLACDAFDGKKRSNKFGIFIESLPEVGSLLNQNKNKSMSTMTS